MKRETLTVQSQFEYGEARKTPELTHDGNEIEVLTFPDEVEPARASVSLGGTLNMGNYSSVKYNVAVSLPCYSEEIEAALEAAQAIAERKAEQIVDQVQAHKAGGKR